MTRILLVEDDKGLRRVCREILSELPDVHVDDTENGTTALAMFEAEPYDLVVTDLNVPGLDGCELVERIMAIDRGSRPVPGVVYASAVQKALKIAVEGSARERRRYLMKPFGRNDLVTAVREVLEMPRDWPDDCG